MSDPGATQDPFAPRPVVAPASPPARPAGTGPTVLVVLGAAALVGTVVLAVVTARIFLGVLPTGVLTADGTAGPDVVAEVDAPGEASVTLAEGTYTVLLRTVGAQDTLVGPLVVTGPDGEPVRVRPAALDLTTARGGSHAVSVADLEADTSGDYVISAPRTSRGATASLLVVEDAGFGSFMGSIFGTIAGVFGVFLLGATGLGLLIGGLIWRYARRRPRGGAHGGPAPAGPPGTAGPH